MGFSVSANTPLQGYISWSDVHIVYDGVDYPVADGSTNQRFAYWEKANPGAFGFSDTYPPLTQDDCIVFLNKGGVPISVLTASSTEGDLVVPGTITSAAIATEAIDAQHIKTDAIIARHILAGSIVAEKLAVDELSAISANLGTVTAGNFTLDADGFIKGGAVNFAAGNGFWMGHHQGAYKFRAGTPGSSMMEWNGQAFNIYGPDGQLTISSGVVDYTKIPNQPTSLTDINGAEGEKLATVQPGATRNAYRGAWAHPQVYEEGDMVTDGGSGWTCTQPHSSAADRRPPTYPTLSNAYWSLTVAKGEDGIDYDVQIESTNGTVFRVGQARTTMLIARVFRNGFEVTDLIDSSKFKWVRVSLDPKPAPNDDATWNATYAQGYKQIMVSVDDVHARATFHCQILN